MAGESVTTAAAKGATYLMALQISSRALTFLLNQIVLRFLTPEIFGRAVQLELYSISVLFFARESLRVAVQRVGVTETAPATTQPANVQVKRGKQALAADANAPGRAVQTVINLSYVVMLLGLPLILGLGLVCYRALEATSGGLKTSAYGILPAEDPLVQAVIIYGMATFTELACEPGFAAAQSMLLYKVRAAAEASATVAKTLVTVGTAVASHRLKLNLDVLPFAYGQMAYGFVLMVYYTFKITPIGPRMGFKLALAKIKDDKDYLLGCFSKPLLTIATSLSVQSGLKYVLTQGDSILIATMAPLQEQGTYALAANYGGLIARMLFQPIEEASRNLFAKLCADPGTGEKAEAAGKRANVQQIRRASDILGMILELYFLMGTLAISLGPQLAPLLLSLIVDRTWLALGAGEVLAAYTYYIPLLAVNGVLEAFVAAVATNKQLNQQSLWMGLFFTLFAGSAWLFISHLQYGAQGIVIANCINMACRIAYCYWFISDYFKARGVMVELTPNEVPDWRILGGIVAVPILVRKTDGMLSSYGVLGELVRMGSISALLVLIIIWRKWEFFKRCYGMIRGSAE